ncbi:peptidase [Streptomyces sp. RB6PN25]|uniref:Peptidase n=1 Tax=Streptomyces humicola TaxID=2953240 RepID=A0ABT1Q4K4_9ACTN|nr:Clp protease N-terminal domain-containing protein [Streptomyces humicola]MCQ4084861.1 peptidase [Streptomyces humicola]
MHSDTRPEDPTRDDVPQLSRELGTAVASARRRASRDGDRQLDTAHLLHSLLESDQRSREVLGSAGGQVVRVLAYLAQRTIGYGIRWRGTIEDSGALPVVAAGAAPGWSPAASAALHDAEARAAARGRPVAEGTDLLGALAADPECRAVEVLRAAGIDPQRLTSVLSGRGAVRGYRDDGPVAS